MIDKVGGVDMELLREQSNDTYLMPDGGEGIGNFLSWIISAIEEYGYVIVYDADTPFGNMPTTLQGVMLEQQAEKSKNKGATQ